MFLLTLTLLFPLVYAAVQAHVRFIVTYNQKDFRSERIKDDFRIIVLTPGQLLQYLRSLR